MIVSYIIVNYVKEKIIKFYYILYYIKLYYELNYIILYIYIYLLYYIILCCIISYYMILNKKYVILYDMK